MSYDESPRQRRPVTVSSLSQELRRDFSDEQYNQPFSHLNQDSNSKGGHQVTLRPEI